VQKRVVSLPDSFPRNPDISAAALTTAKILIFSVGVFARWHLYIYSRRLTKGGIDANQKEDKEEE
jgi:hypothetical protein